MKITIDDAKVNRAIDRLRREMHDWKPLMKDVGKFLKADVDANFEKAGGLFMKPNFWKPLSISTQKDRIRKGYGAKKKILIRTGRLKRQIGYKAEKDKVTLESGTPYFKYHQLGGKKIPKRTILTITPQAIPSIRKIARDYIIKKTSKAWNTI